MLNHGLTEIKGVFPDYRLTSFKSYAHPKGGTQFYFDYSAFCQKSKKLKRVIRKAPFGLKKRAARNWAAPLMSLVDSLLQKGYHFVDESSPELLPVLDAIEFFLQEKLPKVRSKKDYHTIYQIFSEYAEANWENKKISDITKRDIKSFLDVTGRERNWKNQTRNNKKHLLSSMFEHFKELDVIQVNPCRLVKNERRQAVAHYEVFNEQHLQEVRAIIRDLDFQLYVAVNLIYYCFLRPETLRQIKVGHFSIKDRMLLVHADNVKDNQMRYIYLPTEMIHILTESKFLHYADNLYLFSKNKVPGTKQLAYHYLRNECKKVLAKMALDKTHSLYCFKPTGICQMYKQTRDIMAIKERGGFSSLDIVQVYLSKYNMLFQDRIDFV